MWHKHHRDDFCNDGHGAQWILRHGAQQSNPTVNPRFRELEIYIPACNNRSSTTQGIIAGIPAIAVKHRRGYLDLSTTIHDHLFGHLPSQFQLFDDFSQHFGCRDGTFSGDLCNKQRGQVPVIYFSASSRHNFKIFLRAYNAFHQAAKGNEITWRENALQVLPIPKNQQTRTTTLEALKDLDQHFGASVRIRLHPLNDLATEDEWDQLTEIPHYQAAYPEFCHHDPEPVAYYYSSSEWK